MDGVSRIIKSTDDKILFQAFRAGSLEHEHCNQTSQIHALTLYSSGQCITSLCLGFFISKMKITVISM